MRAKFTSNPAKSDCAGDVPYADLCSPIARHTVLELFKLAFTSVFVARSFEIDMHVREELNWY